MITFANKSDRDKVLDGDPWLFENSLLVLKLFDGRTKSHLLDFDREDFWIQMFNLPLGGMNRRMGEKIGNSIGRVVEVDVNESKVV